MNRPKAPKYTKEEIRDYEEKLKNTDFEKGDMMAMIIAAMITIMPAMLAVIAFMIGIVWLIFLR
ncbi:MAG: hypothetical protein CVU85_05240 [Firmicutes bacterium HGW-Firmicutes-10]|nr:MAG: hypothetical protein CVU85_05240 [Firmicutes bacterium HGW-Firmicutes-10]